MSVARDARMHLARLALVTEIVCVLGCFDGSERTRDSDQSLHPAHTGTLGPLHAMHKDAIHAGLLWNGIDRPKILFWMNNAEYRGTDLVDPQQGELGELRPEFQELVRGGFSFSGLLDGSIRNRYKPDIERDNTLIWDLGHPDALLTAGKFAVADLTADDIALNAAAFSDAGDARGLHYNLFCAGHAVLADGRWLLVGGHDKGGNNGIRKMLVFDPATERWDPMPIPPVKEDYLADPTGTVPHADPLDEANTDPPHPTDMIYQRWYASSITLPDGRVLVLSGTDQDTSVGPAQARFTKVRIATPEVYDATTGQTIALESARKLLYMYPHSFVVQTGRGADDWKVAVIGPIKPPFPDEIEIGQFDPWHYSGKTFLFDVRAALADPTRHVPAERHWQHVATARANHDEGASAAIWELDERGSPRMQKIVLFGGHDKLGDFDEIATVESIDFSRPHPTWRRHDDLPRPAARNWAVVLPDGNVLVLGGRTEDATAGVVGVSLEYQLFDHRSGTLRTVATTTVPRHDHSTAQLLPDGTVVAMGGNRGELVLGDPDAGVPVAQFYSPPYLFRGPRPEIENVAAELEYGSHFELQLATGSPPVTAVSLIRMEPVTHNWSWGIRYLKLTSEDAGGGRLRVRAPALPSIAPPGDYMLFALTEDGVPSVARQVRFGVP
jgi:hypothetical protein